MIDDKIAEHRAHIRGLIPRLASDPPIGGKHPYRKAGRSHRDCDQMTERKVVGGHRLLTGQRLNKLAGRRHVGGFRSPRHAAGPQERVKVTVLGPASLARRMRMIIKLRVSDRIVDIVARVMVPLAEEALITQHLADDIVAGLRQRAVTFADLAARGGHDL